jgi:hypothetical protein
MRSNRAIKEALFGWCETIGLEIACPEQREGQAEFHNPCGGHDSRDIEAQGQLWMIYRDRCDPGRVRPHSIVHITRTIDPKTPQSFNFLIFQQTARCLIPGFDGASLSAESKDALWQVLHGSATMTEAIRRAIQHSQASLRTLAKRYGINQKTVAKWKKRTSVADLPTGPRQAKSTVLSVDLSAGLILDQNH